MNRLHYKKSIFHSFLGLFSFSRIPLYLSIQSVAVSQTLFCWPGQFGGVLAGCLVRCPTTGNPLVFSSWLDWIYGFWQASQVVLVVKNLPARRHKGPVLNPWVRKIPWRRKWQSTPVSLPGESHGQRSLAGYIPWGHKKLDMTEHTHKTSHFWQGRLWDKMFFFDIILS